MTHATVWLDAADLALRNPHTLDSGRRALHSDAGDIHLILVANTPAELRDLAQRLVLRADEWETEIADEWKTLANEVTS